MSMCASVNVCCKYVRACVYVFVYTCACGMIATISRCITDLWQHRRRLSQQWGQSSKDLLMFSSREVLLHLSMKTTKRTHNQITEAANNQNNLQSKEENSVQTSKYHHNTSQHVTTRHHNTSFFARIFRSFFSFFFKFLINNLQCFLLGNVINNVNSFFHCG